MRSPRTEFDVPFRTFLKLFAAASIGWALVKLAVFLLAVTEADERGSGDGPRARQ